MSRRIVTLAILAALVAPANLAAQSQAQPVTLAQFRQLSWLNGTWRGSGGAYPAFFESYRFVNDSTVRMHAYKDSTFRVATDSSLIEFRRGTVKTSGGSSTYHAVELTPSSVHFVKVGVSSGGHTFAKKTADHWTATLHGNTPQARATVYEMRRVGK